MDDVSTGNMVKDLHKDLVRKYKKHAATVESYWRTFNQSQRTQCIKAGAAEGAVLKHSLDRPFGNVYKFIPEINLRDLANPASDLLLDILRHRATSSLLDQYMDGLDGKPGDHTFMKEMMDTRNLRLRNPDANGFTIFLDNEKYGRSFTITREKSQVLASLKCAIDACLCVSQELGELILQRQMYTLQFLNIFIEDILDMGSKTRDRQKLSKVSNKAAQDALAKLSIQEPVKSFSLPDLVKSAADQKAALADYLSLLSTEPVVLTHDVNSCFFSRPELLPDEKGRSLPAHTDKYISGAVLEAVYKSIKALAIWTYIDRLLDLLVSGPASDKVYRAIVLQEISNVCHLEYSRVQALFRRQVQTGTGAKWFKRKSNAFDKAGDARVTMVGDPGTLTRSDPQLHYTLRLCQPETDAFKAVEWIKTLNNYHQAHPSDKEERLTDREADSLSDLAVIVLFIQDLRPAISMPPLSRKKNQMFVYQSQQLDAEMNQLKSRIDLRDFVVPIDNLLEPQEAFKALTLLDYFIIENCDTKLGFLYQDLIEDCLADIETQYKATKSQAEQKELAYVPFTPPPVSESREKYREQRKQKEKTRPSPSTDFEIVADPEMNEPVEEVEATVFRVRASTGEVFHALFSNAEARRNVSWNAFTAAMTDLGFSVLPRGGSVYTFSPSAQMNVSRALTLHRPHKPEIERRRAIIYAKRLRRAYGWNSETFVAE